MQIGQPLHVLGAVGSHTCRGDSRLWWEAHLHANTMFCFKSLPINRLVPNILQVGQGSIKLVLLNKCAKDMWV